MFKFGNMKPPLKNELVYLFMVSMCALALAMGQNFVTLAHWRVDAAMRAMHFIHNGNEVISYKVK